MTVAAIEQYLFDETGGRVFISRVRHGDTVVPADPDLLVSPGDHVAVNGRREWMIGGPVTALCVETG